MGRISGREFGSDPSHEASDSDHSSGGIVSHRVNVPTPVLQIGFRTLLTMWVGLIGECENKKTNATINFPILTLPSRHSMSK